MKEKEPFLDKKTLEQKIPSAPSDAIDLLSKLFLYDPKKRLSALQCLQHPFFSELYSPGSDGGLIEGTPIDLYDYEFENYSLNEEILKELILDEIIMLNSKKARNLNKELKEKFPKGILEKIYDRRKNEEKKTEAAPEIKPKESTKDVCIMVESIQEKIDKAEDHRIAHETCSKFIDG